MSTVERAHAHLIIGVDMTLDGYYLVMDWLEVPNLRAHGLAWVVARARRRPPAWNQLDREAATLTYRVHPPR
jgi:hypothetical protein